MEKFSYNNCYLMKDGTPWFPVMGEIHYSRYPNQYWRESLYKMKAGGVDVASAYVIWIHHEEVEGEFDFTGDRDLRRFIGLCGQCGLYLFLRIGPWCHGEVRNGGFPDWLLNKGFEPRTNSEGYFSEVRRYYSELYKHVEGLLHKDGGPVIGIQIENEYGHAGGLQGEEGERHMRRLYETARDVGFDVPFYTATGWGGAVTGGLIPVMGGYCDAPWDRRLEKLPPSGNYVFTHERNDANIGNDRRLGEGLTFDPGGFPYLTAELGGGLQVTAHRRPVASARDIGAMSLAKLGSGVNLLGYYMYHGGTNPEGKLSTLQESVETGSPNDLPVLSYDFNAPIREYGQISDTYREIKCLSMFIRDFGEGLCEMPAFIPEENPLNPADLDNLRVSVRRNGESGYIFVNNYQRGYSMRAHKGVLLRADIGGESVSFPPINVEDGEYFFFPFNMDVCGGRIKTALATPLCILNRGCPDETYVFYSDREPVYDVEGDVPEGAILTISRQDALNAWKVDIGGMEHLIISGSIVVQKEKSILITGREAVAFKMYPKPDYSFDGFSRLPDDGDFAVFAKPMRVPAAGVEFLEANPDGLELGADEKAYELRLKGMGTENDWFLTLRYEGYGAKAYIGGKIAADSFYTGQVWEIGLKRFCFPEKLTIIVKALKPDERIYLEKWPDMKDGAVCALISAEIHTEMRVELSPQAGA